MPRPFALRFRLPVTPVDRTKVVPNGNPCQIVSIMAEFPRTTVPAAPAQVLFWQKGRGETECAKREDGKKTGGRTRAPSGNRGNATQTGTQEQTVKKTEIWMPRGAATTVNTAERHCGSRTMRTKKTVRTARMIQMIRSSADSADSADSTDSTDSTDGTDGTNWCESATRWTGRRCGESGKSGESGERIERKKQACENAGPTTRPESRTNS